MAEARVRSDYASTRERRIGAWVDAVEPGSPAEDAGIVAGMRVDAVNGVELRDLIDWRWEADGAVAELDVFDPEDGELYEATLVREPGQDWGIDFSDVIFDGIRTCVNACQFCFMSMLPAEARASLTLRDDDYRLSFLQGNFVTLTNLTDEDVDRIIECRLEPMNVSLHAVSPDVRRSLIGRNAQRGMDVLERLVEAGIEIHGQVVLCAGINDGDELTKTLDWVEARPQITSIALVPLGYTKYSKRFSSSYSEDPEASRAVIKTLEPYQRRARETLGITRFQLSDEFYVDAGLPMPEAESYDDYPQFYDGIGMLRSFLDEAALVRAEHSEALFSTRDALRERGLRVMLVCGEAADETIATFCRLWDDQGRILTKAIRNDYFGGDVNVTGLIVSEDLLAQLPEDLSNTIVVLPEVMFNFDKVTLDGDTQERILSELARRGAIPCVSMPNPSDFVTVVGKALGGGFPSISFC